MIFGIISLVVLLFSTAVLGRLLRPPGRVAYIIFFFLVLTGQIIVIAFILSALNVLSSTLYWLLFSLAALLLTGLAGLSNRSRRGRVFSRIPLPPISLIFKQWHQELSRTGKIIIFSLLITTLLVGLLNLIGIAFIAPGNYDGMAYRLARVAYYLQHDNIGYFDANYANQVVIQKNAELLMLYAFLVSGRSENITQLVQFIAWWVAIVSVYGISREIGLRQPSSLFPALVFALLTECILQSTTVQNDMLLTAYLGVVVYSLFAFRNSRRKIFLLAAGMGLALALGVKASLFLLIPSLIVITVYTFFCPNAPAWSSKAKNFLLFLIISFFAICVLALPSGYLENYRLFKHPLGPKSFRVPLSFEGKPFDYILLHGSKNLMRYGFDFLALDGFPPTKLIRKLQAVVNYIPKVIIKSIGMDLESKEAMVETWNFDEPPTIHEDFSCWGIYGFTLILPALLLLLLGYFKNFEGRVLLLAFVLFILMQSYSGAYGFCAAGRWSIYGAVFACPVAGLLLDQKGRSVRIYLLIVVLIGCLSAFISTFIRYDQFNHYASRYSLLFQDRMTQLTVYCDRWAESCKRFEKLVPPDATVAVCINPNSYEYPLFGYKLTRTIVPLNSFWRGRRPLLEDADYLLFSDDFDDIFERSPYDIHLGWDWHLIKLK